MSILNKMGDQMIRNLTTSEATEFLKSIGIHVSATTLNIMRSQKRGPRYRKVLNRVYYNPSDLELFAQGVTVNPSK